MYKKFKIIIVFLIYFCFVQGQNIKLIFRYDDFFLKSDLLDEGVVRIFQKHHIPLVLGVIPCDSTEKMILERNYPFLSTLKEGIQNQSVEIALHGLTHIKIANGEFGNLNRVEQYRRIRKGKAILDSIFNIRVVTFIPPFNAYDENTLNALVENKFKGVSSALCIGQNFSNKTISYFPETIENFGTLENVLSLNKNRNVVVVVMFHHYTFRKGYSLSNLDHLLLSVSQLKQVHCVTFKQLYEGNEISDGSRMNANMESNLCFKLLKLEDTIQSTYFSYFVRILNILVYMAFCLLVYVLSRWLINKSTSNSIKIKLFSISILLLIVSLSVFFHMFSPLKLLLMLAILSAIWPFISLIKKTN